MTFFISFAVHLQSWAIIYNFWIWMISIELLLLVADYIKIGRKNGSERRNLEPKKMILTWILPFLLVIYAIFWKFEKCEISEFLKSLNTRQIVLKNSRTAAGVKLSEEFFEGISKDTLKWGNPTEFSRFYIKYFY